MCGGGGDALQGCGDKAGAGIGSLVPKVLPFRNEESLLEQHWSAMVGRSADGF